MRVPRYSSFIPKYKDPNIFYELKRKDINTLNSSQSIKRTKQAITKYNFFLDTHSLFTNLLPHYFAWFKSLALVTHKTLRLYYYMNGISETTFMYYCKGVFKCCDIGRLFKLFAYFRYNPYMIEALNSVGCNVEKIDFNEFLTLKGLPLPEGKTISIDIDYNSLLPYEFKDPSTVVMDKRKRYDKKSKQ